jgi:hypothetical protein|tara:strand:+ start:2180 stop:3265 length:1086 start_codon:yes stop_codon:yes gene_type:complete
MAVSFNTFFLTAKPIFDCTLPVLLRGRHGVGKSQVVYQIANTRSLPVVERRASQMTEGDLLGLPDVADTEINGRKATTWNAPDWLVTACEHPVVLFLDEVDRATVEVRQGLFELTDSRKLNGWNLHPETLIIAAVNGGEHGAQYQVGEMDPAELDRWTVFDVEPTVEDWLKWANDGNITGIIWDFINHNHSHLEHQGEFEPNKVYPSRRSWKRFNDVAVRTSVLEEKGSMDMLYNLANAFLGFEAAVALRDFVDKYEWQVSVEDILENGEIEKTAEWGINDHSAMIEKFDASGVLKEDLNETQVANLAQYFVTLPSEVAMKLWSVLGDADNIENVIRLHKAFTPDGKSVSEHLVEILGGNE